MGKKILILAANPKNTSRLRLDEEVREIENGLRGAQHRDEFTLKQVWAPRPSDIRRAMLDFRPQIVHFCGHGKGDEGIAFEDSSGNAKIVSADILSGFFELFAEKLECVVLNACYSEVQAEAIAEYINYVLGMNKAIGDEAAIEFSVAFYDALGAGETIEFAYKLACNAIQWAGKPEHLTPILKSKPQTPLIASQASLLILVTGGLDASATEVELAHKIGQQVVLRGHTLMSNGSRGIDKAAGEGAIRSCNLMNIDSTKKIQVFRPYNNSSVAFPLGKVTLVGSNYDERRDYVIRNSDVVILLGGGGGTKDVARIAKLMNKPIIPIGIGDMGKAAVDLWREMVQGEFLSESKNLLTKNDLKNIGPDQHDLNQVANYAITLAERMVNE